MPPLYRFTTIDVLLRLDPHVTFEQWTQLVCVFQNVSITAPKITAQRIINIVPDSLWCSAIQDIQQFEKQCFRVFDPRQKPSSAYERKTVH